MLIADVLVASRRIVLANTSGIVDPEDVTLVAEIVSPGSRFMDWQAKPAIYAGAGIPSFWRAELEEVPVIFAYGLSDGRYVELGVARPGGRLTIHEPFHVTTDPADLQP